MRAEPGARGAHRRNGKETLSTSLTPPKLSDELEQWLTSDGEKTLGSLVERFGEKSFAIVFLLLLAVPALPLPTGGATHVFEIMAMLIALELIAGREHLWLPKRWRSLELAGEKRQRFIAALMRMIRRLERISRPRLQFLFHGRASEIVFGALVICGSLAAFLAPPFTGLDTLPSLAVVLLSLAKLLEDSVVAAMAIIAAVVGVVLEIAIGAAAIHGIGAIL